MTKSSVVLNDKSDMSL